MSIKFKILGRPGRDNALFVWLNSGTKLYRMLFDCGENIFYGLRQSDVKSIDYLFLSHLHVDHIAGFDYYFRRNFDRESTNYIWGPEETSGIINNRLKGYMWNLTAGSPGEFLVTDINPEGVVTKRFLTSEGFRKKHSVKNKNTFSKDSLIKIIDTPDFSVLSTGLNHSITTIAYAVYEKESYNINKDELERSGLTAGKWLEKVRDVSIPGDTEIETDDRKFKLSLLREKLLRVTEGDSIAYMTDFLLDDKSKANAVSLAKGCGTLVCESQYHSSDNELAFKNFHLTSVQAAEIARDAGVKKLMLFHISERYTANNDYLKLLDDARSVFPETYLPEGWE